MRSSSIVGGEGQEGDDARALDVQREITLMLGAHARNAPRHDLAAIADEITQHARILVVDDDSAIVAERTSTTPRTTERIAFALERFASARVSSSVHSSSSSSSSKFSSSSIERACSV